MQKKMKFSSKDFFSKCDQIRWKQRIWSHLLKKSLMEDFIFCVVNIFEIFNVLVQVRLTSNRTCILYKYFVYDLLPNNLILGFQETRKHYRIYFKSLVAALKSTQKWISKFFQSPSTLLDFLT